MVKTNAPVRRRGRGPSKERDIESARAQQSVFYTTKFRKVTNDQQLGIKTDTDVFQRTTDSYYRSYQQERGESPLAFAIWLAAPFLVSVQYLETSC